MTPSAVDIGATLILVLPGFLSYRSALSRRADPSRRSVLWQLAQMLEYSVYVHLLGIGLVFAFAALLHGVFHVETHLNELLSSRPNEFLKKYFVEGTLLFTLYPLYVVVAAVLMGAYDAPHVFATAIVRIGGLVVSALSWLPLMGWMKPPTPDFPVEPIWYKTFNVATDGFRQSRPEVVVIMKRGDMYYGRLGSYPILPDSESSKDFLITDAVYAPAGRGSSYELSSEKGGGSVLLNSSDVDSIQVYYRPADSTAGPDA